MLRGAVGNAALDASLLLIPLVGFLPVHDPRVVATIEAIERKLVIDGFVDCWPRNTTRFQGGYSATFRRLSRTSGWSTLRINLGRSVGPAQQRTDTDLQ